MRTTRIFGISIALILLFCAIPASAEISFSERLNDQLVRIDDSVEIGALSFSQARWLKRQHRTIRIQAEIYANRSNLTGAERARLNTYLSELDQSLDLYIVMNQENRPDGVAVSQSE